MDSPTLRRKLMIPEDAYIGIRCGALLVEAGKPFESEVTYACGDQAADGRSILNILALAPMPGAEWTVEVTGEDAEETMAAIEGCFANWPRVDG